MKAMEILVVVLFQNNKDTVVEQWHCDGNCNRNHGVGDFCPGVMILQKNYVSIFLIHPIFNRYKITTIIHSRFCLFDKFFDSFFIFSFIKFFNIIENIMKTYLRHKKTNPNRVSCIKKARKVRAYSLMERMMGIEPTWSAWKAEVLPLNYIRKSSRQYKLYYNCP